MVKPRIDVYDTTTSPAFDAYRTRLASGKIEPRPRWYAEVVLEEYVTDQNYPGSTAVSAYGDTPEAARQNAVDRLMKAVADAEVVSR